MSATKKHWNIKLNSAIDRASLLSNLAQGKFENELSCLAGLNFQIISPQSILHFVDEELRHDNLNIKNQTGQLLATMSSGERKKAYFEFVINQNPTVLILDHFFDNLDKSTILEFTALLKSLSTQFHIIHIYTRDTDQLSFIIRSIVFENETLISQNKLEEGKHSSIVDSQFLGVLPPPIRSINWSGSLVSFKNVSVSHLNKLILDHINWEIDAGQFWNLYGPNGSGKTTLLTMITGDNPKAYGQDITLFGKKKGTGESIWEIKQKIGYFTSNMTFQFNRKTSALDMVISGFYDTIGLYVKAGDHHRKLGLAWLTFLQLNSYATTPFAKLSLCHQRMVMIARSMVKHPPLLILDEPTVDLDEQSAQLIVQLINQISKESQTAIIYVSHRIEPSLTPTYRLGLIKGENGSYGSINNHCMD